MISLLGLLSALLLVACYTGPDAVYYGGVLDDLGIPADWELVRTSVRGPDGDRHCTPPLNADCPAVVKYYLVDAEPLDLYVEAQAIALAAGFVVDREFSPKCDKGESASACDFLAGREDEQLFVSVFDRGNDDGTGFGEPGLSAIRIMAEARSR